MRLGRIPDYIGTAVYAGYVIYVVVINKTNHTAYEPLYLLLVPTTLLLSVLMTGTRRDQMRLLLLIGLMVTISLCFEVFNGMLSYQRWATAGMPEKWSWQP
ncbi:MAG: hypothetical protein OEZ39_11480 [Gammaproteobacteria bacterium]|nr:hypothetical protein [Gammaproteobacteria bacterium]MDH5652464.1 hypothetical protein [Gammaproteobacteria bacterium]